MNTRLLRKIALLSAGLASILTSYADVYTTQDGTSYDGRISKVLNESVHLLVGDAKSTVALGSFDADSKAAIEAWMKENPLKVDVHTKWDVQPVIKSSAMPALPEQFKASPFKGMVSVDLVLDESGQVIHASVRKSTHAELDTPSVEAAKAWLFEPAQVGGKKVRSKLRVPFKFVYTPPAKEKPAS